MDPVTVFRARRILRLSSGQPDDTHIAVRAGRILAVGNRADAEGWGAVETWDDRFADHVLIPGFVEGHAHTWEANLWTLGTYVGAFDRIDPQGRNHHARKSVTEVVKALREAQAVVVTPSQTPLFAWGVDPFFYPSGPRIDADMLDRVSPDRPIIVQHASGHVLSLNSAALSRVRFDPGSDGVIRRVDGTPTGEVQGLRSIMTVANQLLPSLFQPPDPVTTLDVTASIARRAGVTTFADMGASIYLNPRGLAAAQKRTLTEDFPMRLVAVLAPKLAGYSDPNEAVEYMLGIAGSGNDKLHFGSVKLVTDGSIQGGTARLRWPFYYRTGTNGSWNTDPDELREWVLAFHRNGFQIHCHCNGDEASEVFIDAVGHALRELPRWDHRHTVQHGQLVDEAQFRRMASLGMCANLFINHLYFWGDIHHDETLGPDRSARMNDCASALRLRVPFTFHSDAPITPMGPMFSVWCAVNRTTMSGRVLGPNARISTWEALRAATLGSAYTLKLDHLVGSIEAGKFADFTVLDTNPLDVDPVDLNEVSVIGTVVGGRVAE